MAPKTRNSAQIEQDRALIAEYYLRGWTQKAIAEKLGLTRDVIKYDLNKIHDDWRKSTAYDFDLAKQRQLERIDLLEREAWAAWEGSKAPRERKRTRSAQSAPEGAAPTIRNNSAEVMTEQRDPDPRYLVVVQWCIDARAKLLGQYAPIGVHHSGSVTTNQIVEFVYEVPADVPVAGLTIIGVDAPAALPEPTPVEEVEAELTEFDRVI